MIFGFKEVGRQTGIFVAHEIAVDRCTHTAFAVLVGNNGEVVHELDACTLAQLGGIVLDGHEAELLIDGFGCVFLGQIGIGEAYTHCQTQHQGVGIFHPFLGVAGIDGVEVGHHGKTVACVVRQCLDGFVEIGKHCAVDFLFRVKRNGECGIAGMGVGHRAECLEGLVPA